MAAWINIAKDDIKPLYIDAPSVTALHFNDNTLTLFNELGVLMNVKATDWNLELSSVLQKLEGAGSGLVPFPVRWPAENDTYEEYEHYIAPRAVTYVNITKPENGTLAAIVGVKGSVRAESYNLTEQEFNVLITAIQNEKKIVHYAPEDAHSDWVGEGGGIYIDPASVTRICQDPAQINVNFEKSDSINIQTPKLKKTSDVIREVFARAGKPFDADAPEMDEVYDIISDRERQMRKDFADALAAANGTLIKVEAAFYAFHIRREDIGLIYFDDGKSGTFNMFVQDQRTAANPHPVSRRIVFKTAEDRLKGVASLNGVRQAGVPQPVPAL